VGQQGEARHPVARYPCPLGARGPGGGEGGPEEDEGRTACGCLWFEELTAGHECLF
jgi:hypothetical protein